MRFDTPGQLARDTLLSALLMLMWAILCAQVASPARAQSQPEAVDCSAASWGETSNVLVERFTAMSLSVRRECLNQLLRNIQPPDVPSAEPFLSALGIAELTRAGLIEDADMFRPLIECVRTFGDGPGVFCNEALTTLTRQRYSQFADWRAYETLLEGGHPVFDKLMADICARAVRSVEARLAVALSASAPNHMLLRDLRSAYPLSRDGQVIYSFAAGNSDVLNRWGLVQRANWVPQKSPSGLRILLFRPGISEPSRHVSYPVPWELDINGSEAVLQRFPVEAADFHEHFPALDLEIRFQIVTPNERQRRSAVTAVREALSELRSTSTAPPR